MAAIVNRKGSQGSAVCERVRADLSAAGSGPLAALVSRGMTASDRSRLAEHVDSCADCAAFARRLELAREALGRPLSPPWAVVPDANFAARVAARIERPAELIGWAAFRALPAALGLAMALALLGLTWTPPVAPAVAAAAAPEPPRLLLDEPSADQLVAFASAPVEAAQ